MILPSVSFCSWRVGAKAVVNEFLYLCLSFLMKYITKKNKCPEAQMSRMIVMNATPCCRILGSLVRMPVKGDWLRKVSAADRMFAGTTVFAELMIGGIYWPIVWRMPTVKVLEMAWRAWPFWMASVTSCLCCLLKTSRATTSVTFVGCKSSGS